MLETLLAIALALLLILYRRTRSAKKALREAQDETFLLKQERQMVIEFMHNMVEALGEGTQREELFERITHAAVKSTGAMTAAIFENVDGQLLRCASIEGLFPPHKPLRSDEMADLSTRSKFLERILRAESFPIGEGVVGKVAETKKGVLIRDAISDGRIFQHSDEALRVHSIIASPILFRNELIGVLCVANPANRQPFTDVDFSLVDNIAEHAGMALHNAANIHLLLEKNRLDVDIELAANIQRLLLPSVYPDLKQLDIASTYILAQKVGGDLYDVFQIDENRIGVAIADVSGKGISGSLMMAITQTHLRHFALSLESPSEVLKAMNQELMEAGMRKEMFITFVYAIIDVSENTVTVARAGHELPVVVRRTLNAEATVEKIESSGMALGMVENRIFSHTLKDVSVPFNPGDILFLYTDGITETANRDGKEFSYARLADILQENAEISMNELNELLLKQVERFSETDHYDDDLTMVSVKYRLSCDLR
ncbi:MAG: GAF domain-containing SpoIIE family protein phosphatase [Verrucomicrobiota bacterium]